MALAFVQRGNGGNTASASTVALAYGSTTASGSLLAFGVATSGYSGSSVVSSVADSAGNTYISAVVGQAGNNTVEIWYCANATANAGTITVTFTSAQVYRAISIIEFSGEATSSVLNTTGNGHAASGTAIATGTITLVASSEAIFAMMLGFGSPITAGTGYTLTNYAITGDGTTYYADEYHITSSSEAASATQNSSATWGIVAASFKVASSGTTFNQTVAATTTPVSSIARSTTKIQAATTTPTASLTRQTGKPLNATTTPVASLTRQAGKSLQAVTTPVASMAKQTGKLMAAIARVSASMLINGQPPGFISTVRNSLMLAMHRMMGR